ncbi:hypothetical protein D477_001154 [Arthrobacter crystallopoietes BAB-32]|uniref:DUF445 domain-containing protein n=1 Tax=Arthrobacter crystallopoietes BAB-32 TaxID=1246476 RepID=N1V7F8_9MICC|nr:DUF445 family protein [Arthrobacter crystallopoietes]EMY36047.1 hypothetical protein D477_001154 [Arthrobacter crystallopoietes BAB-32]
MSTQVKYDGGAQLMTDAERAAGLRKMKRLAGGLLLAMAVVFVVAFALQEQYPWLQYVRAAAEGGMVGALADWFAVTALFRHPLGLKIPHTAIIPRKKDQIGASLGGFVEANFLSEEVVKAKIASLGVSARTGAWLARPQNADRVAREGAATIRAAMLVLNDEDVQDVIESMARRHLLAPEWGPPLGKVAQRVLDDGHHLKLVDLLLDRAADWVLDNPETISRLVAERSPTWVPSFVDTLMGDKVHIELYKFIAAVQDDPDHQVRRQLDAYLHSLAQDLQHDPDMIARVENLKNNALGDPEVRQLAARTWETLKRALLQAVEDPHSELSLKFTAAVRDFGNRLATDQELAAKVDGWIEEAAGYLVRTYRSQIAGVITETVERWDAQETSEKIELQVGRDLQFIRINGTVVGSLAGLLIFTIAHAVFG